MRTIFYDADLAWHKSRWAADDFGGGHAHVGMAIYQADHFSVEWRNRLLMESAWQEAQSKALEETGQWICWKARDGCL